MRKGRQRCRPFSFGRCPRGRGSADQKQIQHDSGDTARHGEAEDDDAAELIDGVDVLTDAMLEIVG